MPAHDYTNFFRGVPVLITGGAGFIGSHLAHRLVQLGANVRVLDDLSGGFRKNVPDGARLIEGSILDQAIVREAASGVRYVFHQAAMVSVPESVDHPRRCVEVNIVGTEHVLEAARESGVRRVMFAGSAAAYGPTPQLPSSEAHAPDCNSPYAASKVAGEALMQAFARCHEISTVNLRYFNIFGPRQNPDSPYAAAISAFHKAFRSGRQPTIFGDGQQTRDFTYIENVVHANLLAASSPRDLRGEIINIGTGTRISLIDVICALARVLEIQPQPTFGPPRAGDVRHSVADISRARDLLGYQPLVDFHAGIARMVRADCD